MTAIKLIGDEAEKHEMFHIGIRALEDVCAESREKAVEMWSYFMEKTVEMYFDWLDGHDEKALRNCRFGMLVASCIYDTYLRSEPIQYRIVKSKKP